jgi:hypothetical protein
LPGDTCTVTVCDAQKQKKTKEQQNKLEKIHGQIRHAITAISIHLANKIIQVPMQGKCSQLNKQS